MKKINELTEQEILDLTEEQINTMIRFEAAEQGIKLLTLPTKPIYKVVPPPTRKAYTLSCLYSISFSDISIPQQILDLINSTPDKFVTAYKNDFYSAQYIKRKESSDRGEIKVSEVYEESEIESILADAKENKQLKEDYEARASEYKENQKAIDEISKGIYDVVYSVRNKYEILSRYCEMYKNDYLPLANNDETIAMNFIVKAYGLTKEQQQYVSENWDK